MTSQASKATRAVRASIESDTQHGAVVPPLHLSSNFAFAGFGEKRQYDYTRSGNPTRDALGDALAELEGGAGAVVTSSGMAALTLLTQLLEPGDASSHRTIATAEPIVCSSSNRRKGCSRSCSSTRRTSSTASACECGRRSS